MRVLEQGKITYRNQITRDLYLMRILLPKIAAAAQPGQFVHIRVGSHNMPLLRRPFSIQRVEGDELEIILKNAGRGSALMCEKNLGEAVDVMGPLGSVWQIPKEATAVIGVSGGVGIAPVLFQQFEWNREIPFFHFVGSRTKDDLPVSDSYRSDFRIDCATEDGSEGWHGNVISLLANSPNVTEWGASPFVITCGPWGMIRAVDAWRSGHQYQGQFSAEARMGCAVGVCQGCGLAKAGTADQVRSYLLCCKDGPVFDFGTIDLEVNPFGN